MDIFAKMDKTCSSTLAALAGNLVTGLTAVYMLYDVKQQHKNKLGSFQEVAFYFTRDRSLIFIISIIYILENVGICAYAFYYSSNYIFEQIFRILYQHNYIESDGKFWLYSLVLALLALLIYPQTVKQNYQNYGQLSRVLILAIAVAITCACAQIGIALVQLMPGCSSDLKHKYLDLYS